jgi:hypothetical protein
MHVVRVKKIIIAHNKCNQLRMNKKYASTQ